MYKNQLQELAQRSCFNLPSYTCIREGPDHAPRFKAAVNFNGESFESPAFCTTLRQAEHAAAEAALHALSSRGPSHSLAARILDETGVYKNLLQEIAQRVGAPLPSYTTVRSGLGHLPVFTCAVELAGIEFTGEPAKNKKQAEKNAAMAAWSALKQLAKEAASSSSEPENNDEQEQITIARALLNYRLKEKMAMANNPHASPFPKKFPIQPDKKLSLMHPPPATGSKILPLIRPNSTPRTRPTSLATNDRCSPSSPFSQPEYRGGRLHRFPAAGAAPYVPVRHFSMPYHGMAPPVTIRTAVPVFSAPPLPPPTGHQLPPVMNSPVRMASPVRIRPVVPAFAAPLARPAVSPVIPVRLKEQTHVATSPNPPVIPVQVIRKEPPLVALASPDPPAIPAHVKEQPVVAVTLQAPPAIRAQAKEPPPPIDVSLLEPPVKELQVKEQLPVVAVALQDPPAIRAEAKEPPPPIDVPLLEPPVKELQLKEQLPVVEASPQARPPVQIEEVVDGNMNDQLESAALESLKGLEI